MSQLMGADTRRIDLISDGLQRYSQDVLNLRGMAARAYGGTEAVAGASGSIGSGGAKGHLGAEAFAGGSASKGMNNNGGGSSWEGMNSDVVEAQARILRRLSEEVAAVMNKIEGETSQLAEAWHGDDSQKFAADWAGTHKPVFTMAAATLLANLTSSRP